MGRRPGEKRNCAVCGDTANGINFGAPSCLSCKAFFRRNANRKDKVFRCPFNGECRQNMNYLSRKFCSLCRLEKCLAVGMKRELILNEEERAILKQKIAQNRLNKQRQFDVALRQAAAQFPKTESEIGSILSSLTNSPDSEMQSTSSASSTTIDYLEHLDPNGSELKSESSSETSLTFLGSFSTPHEASVIKNNTENIVDGLDLDKYLSNYETENTSWGTYEFERMLGAVDQPTGSLVPFDCILDFIPQLESPSSLELICSSRPLSLPFELGFPEAELLPMERYLLKELNSACSVLKNPYSRMREFESLELEYSGRMTEFILFRLIRAAMSLKSFAKKDRALQGRMLKESLIEMMCLQSVLMYNEYRDAWAFVDDNYQISVLFRTSTIAPYCRKCGFDRHKALPRRFRDEWRQDRIIFHLLTAIILFTPRPKYSEAENAAIKLECDRYSRLLHRYLRITSPDSRDADQCFAILMGNVHEVFALAEDILDFFQIHQVRFQRNPFFVELLDLPGISHINQEPAIEDVTHLEAANTLVENAPTFQESDSSSGVPVDAPAVIGNFWF